jgi:hypothetical protein
MECLQQCKVFVCLLSPNYQKSAYCKRERLMWERKEIRLGRLRKGTYPVYYIRIDKESSEELLISQSDRLKPFFENVEQIREDIIAEKIERVKDISQKVKTQELIEECADSVSIGFYHISPFFVGRLGELSELSEFCTQRHIPIITGFPGVGKTELVVAYASGYAERYPQGRFMLHMEGIQDWNHAIVKFVEDNWYTSTSIKEILALPEDYEEYSIEIKRKMVIQCIWKRAQTGKLLLILDNLDNLNLVTDSGLNGLLEGVGDLPSKVDIIATSRYSDLGRAEHVTALTKKEINPTTLPILYEIDDLDVSSAFELFCQISNNSFPFSKRHPDQNNRKAKKEYNALIEIISWLHGHVWALEIIAAFMAENYHGDLSFKDKLEEIKKSTTSITGKPSYSYRHSASEAKVLLKPTLDYIEKLDLGFKIGKKILELASIASTFSPDKVSDSLLLGYWKKYYSIDNYSALTSGEYAIKQLHAFHIINGEDDNSKMHRITRDLFLAKLLKNKVKSNNLNIRMQQFVSEFLKDNNPNTQQLKSLLGWGINTLDNFPNLNNNYEFLKTLIDICDKAFDVHLSHETEELLNRIISVTRRNNTKVNKIHFKTKDFENNAFLLATSLNYIAIHHSTVNCLREAELEYNESLSIFHDLYNSNPIKYSEDYSSTINNIAVLYESVDRLKDAENKYREELDILRELYKSNKLKYSEILSSALNNIALFHDSVNNFKDAELEYNEAMLIQRKLYVAEPLKYTYGFITTLISIATYHASTERIHEAEAEFCEALSVTRKCYALKPNRYIEVLARLLNNIAKFHISMEQFLEAESEYIEAIILVRQLYTKSADEYAEKLAVLLNNIALLHQTMSKTEDAETEFKESLIIQRDLYKISPKKYAKSLATSLCGIASFHYNMNFITEANSEYNEALLIVRKIYTLNPLKYTEFLATILNNVAMFHFSSNRLIESEEEYKEALLLYRSLYIKRPQKIAYFLATILDNIAFFHDQTNHPLEAEEEYKEAISIWRELYLLNPLKYSNILANSLHKFACFYEEFENAKKADVNYSEALQILRKLYQKNNKRYFNDLIMLLNHIASFHAMIGELEKANNECLESITLIKLSTELKNVKYQIILKTMKSLQKRIQRRILNKCKNISK